MGTAIEYSAESKVLYSVTRLSAQSICISQLKWLKITTFPKQDFGLLLIEFFLKKDEHRDKKNWQQLKIIFSKQLKY